MTKINDLKREDEWRPFKPKMRVFGGFSRVGIGKRIRQNGYICAHEEAVKAQGFESIQNHTKTLRKALNKGISADMTNKIVTIW